MNQLATPRVEGDTVVLYDMTPEEQAAWDRHMEWLDLFLDGPESRAPTKVELIREQLEARKAARHGAKHKRGKRKRRK
ncbi:MAG: hypothetical protein GY851_35410 [bacterium]|nr:hypothetical protein [bacterium]